MNLPSDAELDGFLDAIHRTYHYDFRGYARASLKRRVRDAIVGLGQSTIDGLAERVLADPTVFTRLLEFMTVRVSDMFRDPAYYAVFRSEIVPRLRTYPSRRLWIAGCSTGEEAYSFAIILREEGLLERTTIYATDIHPRSLEIAAAGVYPVDRIQVFTRNHRATGGRVSLSEHYSAAYGRATFDAGLRRAMVFSDHSLATDSVFAEVQVVSCRNVLIYFGDALRDRAVGLFSQALCRRGYLGLGSRESLRLTGHADTFEPLSLEQRWYVKREGR